jgi:subtilisin family serine protease
MRPRARCLPAGVVWLCFWLAQLTFGGQLAPAPLTVAPSPAFRADRILVQPKPGVSPTALADFHSTRQAQPLGSFPGIGDLQILRVPDGETVPNLIAKYERSGLVAFAEPDYFGHVFATPNDPAYTNGTLWALNNTGQNGGTTDADIDAPEAWDVLNSASNIVVAVIDTGVRYTHEDLAANMWVNPNDSSHGLNALAGNDDPSDDSGHGTMVAGILGAVGNNGKGVTGVAWRVQIMACKSFDNFGLGNLSATIACLDYARTNGARIINASWGFNPDSLALSNAVLAARNAGIIVVAACGNSSLNVDVTPSYPATYGFDNILSVAYTTRNDTLGANSNYGATNVDLAAPGEQIYSTFAATDSYYFNGTGSSFAAPFVAGACALMLNKFPTETHQQIIARILNATDSLPSLAGKCVTGGRLNLRQALSPPIQLTPLGTGLPFPFRIAAGPNRSCVVEVSTNLTSWSPVVTNITSAGGTFDYTDSQSTNTARRFYRAVAAP